MKKNYALIALLIIFTGCGGSDSSDSEATATYSADSDNCLIAENSEATAFYTNGNYHSKTLLWNCADYGNYANQHIELFFTSTDGGACFKYNTEYIAEGLCNETATVPNNPNFNATISNLQVNYSLSDSGNPGYDWSATVVNNGDVTLFIANYEQYGFMPNSDPPYTILGSGGVGTIPENGSKNLGGGMWSSSFPSDTYDFTINLYLWDGHYWTQKQHHIQSLEC